MKSGFISIVGRPNVGKSTLINKLIDEKVSIISDKAGTTRENIKCIINKDDKQYIFIDTPGINTPKNLLGEYMVQEAINSLNEVEVILFVIDAKTGLGKEDYGVWNNIKDLGKPIIILLNKIDLVNNEELEKITNEIHEKLDNNLEILNISSEYSLGIYNILPKLDKYLIYDYQFYPTDYYTDMPVNKIVVNIVREKILRLTKDEIPHSVAVNIEDVKSSENSREYFINIYVERDSQKGIVIGQGGKMLKKIREYSTLDITKLTSLKIKLHLWVKVEKNWRKNKTFLTNIGYKND